MKTLPSSLLSLAAALFSGFQAPAQPPLAITSEGNGVRLSWPNSPAYYDLQSSETLAPGFWTAAGEEVLLEAGQYTATAGAGASSRFFRLASKTPFAGSWLKEFVSDDNIANGVVLETIPYEFSVTPAAAPGDFVITILDHDTDLPVSLAGNTLINQAGPIEFPDWRMLNVLLMFDGVNKVFALVGQEHDNPLDISIGVTCWTEAKGSLSASDLAGEWVFHGHGDLNLRHTEEGFDVEEGTGTITAVGPNQILLPFPGLTLTATLSGMEGTLDGAPLDIDGARWHTLKLVSDGIGIAMYFVVSELDDPSDVSLTVLLAARRDEPQSVPGMVWIPPGSFTMGSPETEPGRLAWEGPQTRVSMPRGFWLGRHEVTQAEYEAVRGVNPSEWRGEDLPVEMVSWNDAVAYCQELTARERRAGRLPAGYEYRLPTEAQWECACRAGTTTRFSFGDDDSELGEHAWYLPNGDSRTHVVGEKLPNAWGLYDMHGNVWEWCADWYGDSHPGGNVTDPAGPGSGIWRVFRGGSWSYSAQGCRSAYRYGYAPSSRYNYLGFRVALVAAP